MVNRRTYLKGLTLKGNTACTKKSSERVETEIKGIYTGAFMDRITNLNSKVGSEVPLPYILNEHKDVQGKGYYVVYSLFSQSKQPTSSARKNEGSPKNVSYCPKQMEFAIFRNTKVWGRRRIHSTAFISRKESSKFSVGEVEFEGSTIKDQFDLLYENLKLNKKANNLTTILSNQKFLMRCYLNIKPKPGNMTNSLDKRTLDGINSKWFEKVCNSFRNGFYKFKPSERIHITKSNEKLKPLTIPSLQDKIVQEGMRILLNAVFEKDFRKSSHAFQTNKGCHTALNQIRTEFGKVNWFIEGDINQLYPSIDDKVLIALLRSKIQDEPFIDLIYKYLRAGYGKTAAENIKLMKVGLTHSGLISHVLSNIYMHVLDVWMEDSLILKYSLGKRKKTNLESSKMIWEHGIAVNKTTRTRIPKDLEYGRVYYVRYVDNFIIGVSGSKKTCEIIRDEIKLFLSEKLLLNLDKCKIIHATKGKALFLSYQICCTPIRKMRVGYDTRGRLAKRTTRAILLAPIPMVLQKFKEKGFLNNKNMPTKNGRYVNIDLWNIVDKYRTVERGVLNYYAMANNYGRLAARVHFSLKYSCALTISSKMNLKTVRGAFRKYGKDLTIVGNKRSVSFPKNLIR
jgi:retron-type reverse transcriptase